ncbi:MAG: hypothetical protein R3202_04895, partial [Candidatus Competibacterales bacterium]|nr:hypothetical protein [Candidatus Competibacterales bacterium]
MAADTVRLDVSVVVYRTDYRILDPTLDSLGRALEYAARCGILAAAALYLVDNNPDDRERLRLQQQLARTQVKCRSLALQGEVISGHGNIGYGAGHNLVP